MWNLGQLAELVNGNLLGAPDSPIRNASTITRAVDGDITFVTSEKHLSAFANTPATAALVPRELDCPGKSLIQVDDPYDAFAKVVALMRPPLKRKRVGISPTAHVSPTASIAEDVDVYPGAFIGDEVEIGCGTIIYPNATVMAGSRIGANARIFASAVLYENTIVGDRSIIHGGAVIGAYGFGYKSSSEGHELSPQLGNVVIGSDVEIGSNSTVDRGTFESTTIGDGTKLDDQVMIGHNCQIGQHNLICSQVGIAGSCTTGDFVVMGGQVGLADHVNIGNQVFLHGKCGIMSDVPDGAAMLGAPAYPIRQEMQFIALKPKLPEMRKQIRRLERQLEQLLANSQSSNADGREAA